MENLARLSSNLMIARLELKATRESSSEEIGLYHLTSFQKTVILESVHLGKKTLIHFFPSCLELIDRLSESPSYFLPGILPSFEAHALVTLLEQCIDTLSVYPARFSNQFLGGLHFLKFAHLLALGETLAAVETAIKSIRSYGRFKSLVSQSPALVLVPPVFLLSWFLFEHGHVQEGDEGMALLKTYRNFCQNAATGYEILIKKRNAGT